MALRWTIAKKVGGLAALLITFIIILLINSIVALGEIEGDLAEIAKIDVPLTEIANEIEISQLEQHILMDEIVRKTQIENLSGEHLTSDKNKLIELNSRLNELFRRGEEIVGAALNSDNSAYFFQVRNALLELNQRHKDIDQLLIELLDNDPLVINASFEQILTLDESFDLLAIELIRSLEELTQRKADIALKHEEMFSMVNTSLTVAGGLLGVLLAVGIVLGIRRNIASITSQIDMVNEALKGNNAIPKDAITPIKSNDELGALGKDLSNMITNLSSDLNRREKLSQELNDLATKDHLTGCLNRFKWDETRNEEVTRAIALNQPLSLIFFDIDHFKKINDTYGHDVGDTTLIDVAKVASSSIRNLDTLYRTGGEEFAILLPNTEKEQALGLAERVRAAIENYQFADVQQVTISLGVSQLQLENDSGAEFSKRADLGLYQSKQNGRNCVSFYAGS